MSVTATRLGNSPITIDWSNFARGGATPDPVQFQEAWTGLRGRFESGEVGFYKAPISSAISQIDETEALAKQILGRGTSLLPGTEKITDVLFLGIGGSSLGPLSLLSALREKCTTGIHFHFQENPDPIDWKLTLKRLTPANTLVCCVTKSGTTFETMAQFLLALEWLGKDLWKSNVVAITDPAKGDLKAFAEAQGFTTLHIHPSLGGRFSIFSPVGLFPAALAGLSAKDFLAGANQIREYIEKQPLEKNPLFILGQEFIKGFKTRPMHVCMPYSTELRQLSSWFVQLWAESLGKDGKGFTPLAALGATDQHSILQLLRDGPDDKVTLFITVEKVSDPVKLPRTLPGIELGRYPAFGILQGTSLQDLLNIEYQAISLVLTRRSRPHLTIQIETLDERNLGALYFAFSVLTAVTGSLWGVNPFDQPGVEEGKIYIQESLKRQQSSSRPGEPGSPDDENSPVNRLRRGQFE